MFDFEKQEEKLRMLKQMKENGWETDTDESSSYKEVKMDFDEMISEYDSIDDIMYPNGRDYDAENYDD